MYIHISDKKLEQLTLSEPIYYSSGDMVEKWINNLLCVEYSINANLTHGCPEPQQCKLYPYVDFNFESNIFS